MFSTTAHDVWRQEKKIRPIITLCKQLDNALGNGIAPGLITEFCGFSGTGKTQLCLQLCVNVQIPREIGGVGGRAVFIDTNQDFNPFRLKEIAEASSKRYDEIFKRPAANVNPDEIYSVESILSGISYFYCKDHAELLATVESLNFFIRLDSKIKLIVIDSFCFPFRSMKDHTARTQILYQLLTDLQILADNNELAVVLTNQITTRFLNVTLPYLTPALGDSHCHKIGQQIILGKKLNQRHYFIASLEKTIHPHKYVGFKITEGGIRGIDNS